MGRFVSFYSAIDYSIARLKYEGEDVDTGKWQGIATEGKPDLITKEILNLDFEVALERGSWHDGSMIDWPEAMANETGCNQAWADEHFRERIGGKPLNPDPSHERWPWWAPSKKEVTAATIPIPDTDLETGRTYIAGYEQVFQFTHTYSERFWPKYAGDRKPCSPQGIRYNYGDLDDVLEMLMKDPYTRQAYLPIFFPEDTGAVHGGRIPCSLGYHFLLRNKKLHCWYEIRSCDAVRHFRDDLYLAARLCGWVINQLFERELRSDHKPVWVDVDPGSLYFKAHSFHVHMGDYHLL